MIKPSRTCLDVNYPRFMICGTFYEPNYGGEVQQVVPRQYLTPSPDRTSGTLLPHDGKDVASGGKVQLLKWEENNN